jgi:hypothetical protein
VGLVSFNLSLPLTMAPSKITGVGYLQDIIPGNMVALPMPQALYRMTKQAMKGKAK